MQNARLMALASSMLLLWTEVATAVEVKVVPAGESDARAADCRRMLVGPGVNQPDPHPGYYGFVGWCSPIRLRDGTQLVSFSAGYWHGSPPTPLHIAADKLAAWKKLGMPTDIDAPRGGRAMLIRSADKGRTWSKPRTIIDTPWDDRHPAMVELPNGIIVCSLFTFPGDDDPDKHPELADRVAITRSLDGGRTWEQTPRRLPSPFAAEATDGPPIVLKDGSILLAVYGLPHKEKVWQTGVFRSTDSGETWTLLSTVKTDHDMVEPGLAQLPDGRLVMMTRPEGDIVWSSDGGRTWTKPVTFGMRMFEVRLIVLRDGTLLCLHGSYGRGGFRAIFSTDGGQTWVAPARNYGFAIDPNVYGYGNGVELPDGSVLAAYLHTGGHSTQDARTEALWAIRLRIRPNHQGIDLLPAPGRHQSPDPPLACDLNSKIDPRDAPWTHLGWQKHGVIRLNGSEASQTSPAQLYFIGGEWEYNNSQMPYLVYMPERKRLLLAASVDKPATKATKVFSDDFGKTWTKPTWMHTNAAGNPDLGGATQLTYLGNGKLVIGTESRYWSSKDYGQSWTAYAPVPRGSDGKAMNQWDPMLVDKDPETGKVVRLVETRYKENGTFDTAEYFSQGCVRFSTDEGKTWSKEINVPQWKGVSEIVLCRAKNGDLVAACRTDNPKQFLVGFDDQYSGLATSVSKDNGYTWSELNHLYSWGRHQPHMIVMPNGDIVMTYVVRNGYVADKNGLCRFGIEAVVSQDHGKTWDLDHKYILASNNSIMKGDRQSWGSPQSTSNVLLPDGSLLTVFGTGVRNVPAQTLWKMDVVLVKWRLSSEPVNSEDTLRKAPYQSDLRNKFDLDSVKRRARHG